MQEFVLQNKVRGRKLFLIYILYIYFIYMKIYFGSRKFSPVVSCPCPDFFQVLLKQIETFIHTSKIPL